MVQRMVHDEEDAEDIVQSAFMNASKYRGNFRQEAAVFTWLYAIVRNVAYDFIRRRDEERGHVVHLEDVALSEGRSADHLVEMGSSGSNPEAMLTEPSPRLMSAVLDELVGKIKLQRHREVVRLCREGYANTEIAEILGMPVNSVGTSLHNISLRKFPKLYRQYIEESRSVA
jgi:RNA polymerase sigma-70 factor (ECF subfamily)